MFKINIIHILFFLIIICLLYTLLSDCICSKDYFSVGGQTMDAICMNTELNDNCSTNIDRTDCTGDCHWLKGYLNSFVTYQTYKERITTESVEENIKTYNIWRPTFGRTRQDIIDADAGNNKLGLRIYPNKEKINEIDNDTSLRVYSDIMNDSNSDLMNKYFYYAYFDFENIKYMLVVIKDNEIVTKEILPYDLNYYYKINKDSQPEPVDLTETLRDFLSSIRSQQIRRYDQDTYNKLLQCRRNFFINDNPNINEYYNYGRSDDGSVNNESCCLSVRNLINSKYISTHHNLLDPENVNYNQLDDEDKIIQDKIYKYAQGCADSGLISRLNHEPITASLVEGDDSDKFTPDDWMFPGFPNVGQTMRGIVETPRNLPIIEEEVALLGPTQALVCASGVLLAGVVGSAIITAYNRQNNQRQPISQSDVETGGHGP